MNYITACVAAQLMRAALKDGFGSRGNTKVLIKINVIYGCNPVTDQHQTWQNQ